MAADTDSDERNSGSGTSYTRFMGVGFTFVFTLAALGGLGFLLDRWFGTLPFFLLAGLGLGFVGGLYYVYKVLKQMESG
jgi:ATP synthase protein I